MRQVVCLTIASLLALSALAGLAVSSMASSAGHPLPPVGFRPNLAPPVGASIKVERITLSAEECAAMNHALAAAGKATPSGCQAEHRSYHRNHLALPVGTRLEAGRSGTALADAAYWYWSQWDQECSLYGCWFWAVSLEEDGVANGDHVWQWNEYCTPSGYNTTVNWCGYSHNGGGWPYYGMQFGVNSTSCAYVNGGPACFGHGQRRWIDDYGGLGSYSYW